ncbi:biotin transporter BioY [Lacticaseibacillus pantheris]|jgi:biotin transporter BioY|uniref:biotin transporter BioY n=1 Tax=Lacticaseibacillus pantheris TaxID=171523 RepID=UPI002598F9CD|nr:biotin transporter BioY [Lacticaseibacillus pantheris]WKF84623.1 biotin transporter BioY [Lacticaseibacillus pantheris]
MIRTRTLTNIALGAALMAVTAPFTIPLGPVPLTLQTLMVPLVAGLMDRQSGLWAVMLYVLMGAIGLPVFAGFTGGMAHLVGPTGGYLVGLLLFPALLGGSVRRSRNGWWIGLINIVAGLLQLVVGAVWLHVVTGSAIAIGIVPFLVPLLIKAAVATLGTVAVAPVLRRTGILM